MKISIQTNFPQVAAALKEAERQVPFAMAVALNKTTEKAKGIVQQEMAEKFDRPTRFFMNSLRVIRATKQKQESTLWFKDRAGSAYADDPIALPHIVSGTRSTKPMEKRLQRIGLLPIGWQAVPGGGANIDGNGNMNRGQITQMLNVLGTYTEAGYNKANKGTTDRLAKGTNKSYGFVYWVNKVGDTKAKHIPPGVYKRVKTGFGSSLKPILIFVRSTNYKKRLDFYGVVERTVNQRFGAEFDAAFAAALKSSLLRVQGNLF